LMSNDMYLGEGVHGLFSQGSVARQIIVIIKNQKSWLRINSASTGLMQAMKLLTRK
jgi:hypothetical protein